MKTAFYFMLKVLFVPKIFTFKTWMLGHVGKELDRKVKANVKIYDVIGWVKNNYNIYIAQHLKN